MTYPLEWTTEVERNFDTNGISVYKRARIFIRADSDSRLIQFTVDAAILKTMSREELAAILMPQVLNAIEEAQEFEMKGRS